MEHEIRELGCKCGAQLKIETTIWRGFSDFEMVTCPVCGQDIREIRADMGFKILEVTQSKQPK